MLSTATRYTSVLKVCVSFWLQESSFAFLVLIVTDTKLISKINKIKRPNLPG